MERLCRMTAISSVPSSSLYKKRSLNEYTTLLSHYNSSHSLYISKRSYFWPYNEDFVPKGATPSGFQSSSSPEIRSKILREYALSPLFGARVPCCTLGTMRSAKEMIDIKKEIPLLLCDLLRMKAGSVSLGPLVQTSEMMLYKHDSPLSPRLGDDRNSNINAYGRKPTAARTIMDVFLPEEIPVEEVVGLGHLLCEKLYTVMDEVSNTNTSNNSIHCDSKMSVDAHCMTGSDASGGLSGLKYARVLVDRVGISHCSVPLLDDGGFEFAAVTNSEEADRIMQRWHERDV
ncbi:hypothetical protein LSM04_004935 [Trypanosoma melophagium]|uniref:uncharacterized protein n=1 Tax=Trypanosoma melophagium TaxID=715481 RepID=UPI00351A41A6|nr:hypothetical protein LSM04_004935 [Trypanosoma melophagium]